jgi:hypothetical protein
VYPPRCVCQFAPWRARARDSQWLWPRAASRAVDVERRLGRPDVYRNRRGASSARSAQPQSRIAAPPRRRRESREEMRTPESQCVCMDAWMEMCAGWDGVAGTAPQRPESSVAVVRSVESTREMGHAARGRLGREACKTLYRTLLVRRNVVTIPGSRLPVARHGDGRQTTHSAPDSHRTRHGSPGGGGGAAIK